MNYVSFEMAGKSLKLRLDTKNTRNLERVLGTNPINELMKCSAGQLPTMDFISTTLHASLQKYHHEYTVSKVDEMIDKYIDDGGSLIDLIPILIEVFQVSGYIPKSEDENEVDPK